jgi:hypothetical protein
VPARVTGRRRLHALTNLPDHTGSGLNTGALGPIAFGGADVPDQDVTLHGPAPLPSGAPRQRVDLVEHRVQRGELERRLRRLRRSGRRRADDRRHAGRRRDGHAAAQRRPGRPVRRRADGSAIMSPANRADPDTTDATGSFG